MRNIFLAVFLSVASFAFISCRAPLFSDITINNASDHDVLNISLTYQHGTYGRQVKQIDVLRSGEIRSVSVETQEGLLGVHSAEVAIEYFINGIKYDADNEKSGRRYGAIGGTMTTTFTIHNEYFIITARDIR